VAGGVLAVAMMAAAYFVTIDMDRGCGAFRLRFGIPRIKPRIDGVALRSADIQVFAHVIAIEEL
jgi:hypothetical protein